MPSQSNVKHEEETISHHDSASSPEKTMTSIELRQVGVEGILHTDDGKSRGQDEILLQDVRVRSLTLLFLAHLERDGRVVFLRSTSFAMNHLTKF